MIAAVLASTTTGGIGNRGTLPWPKNKEDLAWFKSITENNIVVMGRNTWNDPQMPKPLPNRINYIASSKHIDTKNNLVKWIPGDLKESIKNIERTYPDKTVYIIGGKQVYESTHELIDRIYLTRIKNNYQSDTRLYLDKFLLGFRLKSVKPGTDCTYEIWDRVVT